MYQKSAPRQIQSMFASIAPSYDKANTLFSFGLHEVWNRKLVQEIGPAKHLLDLCAGTGEIAFRYLKSNPKGRAKLLDFCPEMLAVAEQKGKISKYGLSGRFETVVADAMDLPLSADHFDAVSIAYGIRNVKDPTICFKEVHRVLINGGKMCILELTRPTSALLRTFHRGYTHLFLPTLGKLTAKNKGAYAYLAKSVASFSPPEKLVFEIQEAGFERVQQTPLMGGIATLFSAYKKPNDLD